jgi:serine/threonine protein kinase
MSQPDLIGQRYRVQRAIGQGGMGTVWLCRDETLARDVAVKQVGLLPGESLTDSARALREARSSAALSHRSVVTVFDVVEEAQSIWLVMEYLPSRSLSDVIRDEGPLAPDRAARICAQVADGLAAAHAAGTIHRDVKPGNVLVGEDDEAKISDFGIARRDGDATVTTDGLITGTPHYFSPELATGQPPAAPADVWALGATLYAAVEGSPPYPPQQNALAVLQDIVERRPPAPRHAGELEPVLSRMLDRDPASRWSMADVAQALHRIGDAGVEHTRVVTTATPGVTPSSARSSRGGRAAGVSADPPAETSTDTGARRRRGWLPVAAALAALVVLGGVGLALLLGGDDEGGTPAASPESDGASASSAPETAASEPTPTPSEEPSSSPSPSPSQTASAPAGDRQEQYDAVSTYFSAAPGDPDAGWELVGPEVQQVGRDSYDGFWGSIESVRTSDLEPGPTDDTVEATLLYRFDDGRTVRERQRLTLLRADSGELLINGNTVLSSESVSG